jgi:hypothetical protein
MFDFTIRDGGRGAIRIATCLIGREDPGVPGDERFDGLRRMPGERLDRRRRAAEPDHSLLGIASRSLVSFGRD